MADYPYTTVPSKIETLFKKIQETGVPQKANQKWLQSIGFKSSNDRSLLPILRFLGFTDASNSPTEQWTQYQGVNGNRVFASCICKAYEELFRMYSDAYNRKRNELEAFFSTHSTAGKQAIGKTVSTFMELCKLADFSDTQPTETKTEDITGSAISSEAENRNYKGLTININIQLTLPETTNEDVYNVFFSAMKRHLLQEEA